MYLNNLISWKYIFNFYGHFAGPPRTQTQNKSGKPETACQLWPLAAEI